MCTIISVNTRLTHRDARPNPKSQPATVRTTQRWGRPYPIHYVARLASNERAIWDATSIRDISLCALALACDANASARACSLRAVNTHRIFLKMNVRVQPSRFKLIKKMGNTLRCSLLKVYLIELLFYICVNVDVINTVRHFPLLCPPPSAGGNDAGGARTCGRRNSAPKRWRQNVWKSPQLTTRLFSLDFYLLKDDCKQNVIKNLLTLLKLC